MDSPTILTKGVNVEFTVTSKKGVKLIGVMNPLSCSKVRSTVADDFGCEDGVVNVFTFS